MLRYFILPIRKPFPSYIEIFKEHNRVAKASLLLLFLGLAYTFTVWMGYVNGFGAVVKPIINLPAAEYYKYEVWFGIPVFFVIAIVFGGLTRLLSMAFGGKGSFENNFLVYCTSSVLPTLVLMWLPETILIVFFPDRRSQELGGFEIIPQWLDAGRQIIGVLWPLIISLIGIKASEQLAWWKSAIVTILGFIVAAALMLVFIR